MKRFIFNECGVCINANRYGADFRNEVYTAQLPNGKWCFGYSYQFDDFEAEGGGCGCSGSHDCDYDTERDAAIACAQHLARVAKNKEKSNGRHKQIDQCIALVMDTFCQLTLF